MPRWVKALVAIWVIGFAGGFLTLIGGIALDTSGYHTGEALGIAGAWSMGIAAAVVVVAMFIMLVAWVIQKPGR